MIFLSLRFDKTIRELPEPAVEWVAFSAAVSALNDRTPLVWDPITKKMKKWIDIQKLNRAYSRGNARGLTEKCQDCLLA